MVVNQLLLFIQIFFLLIRNLVFRLLSIFLPLVNSFRTNNFIFQKTVKTAPGQDGGCTVIPGLDALARLCPALVQLTSLSPETVELLVFTLIISLKWVSNSNKLQMIGNRDSKITLRKHRSNFPLFLSKLNLKFSEMC